MHELSLMTDLFHKLEQLAVQNHAKRVVSLRVRFSPDGHLSSEHFREHYERESRGTIAHGARLDLDTDGVPGSDEIVLLSVQLETDD